MKLSPVQSPLSVRVCSSCRARLAPRQSSSTSKAPSTRKYASYVGRTALPETPARTRFAPSPTGSLHLGSIRTALFNYLLAKRTKGQFLLRIEDTDQKRTVPGAEKQLYKDLEWAGLRWDEGPVVGGPFGPYRQSERTGIYRSYVARLLDSKHAYRCFCSSERLDELHRSRHEKGLPLGYDRKCLELPEEESDDRERQGNKFVVRFRAPAQYPQFYDFVYGKTGGQGSTKSQKQHMDHPVYDDAILMKSDGHPTYHFANVVDDHLMEITHVIRGSEWMSSTPLHVALYEAFQWKPPSFGHVPLLVDENRQKLSKRNLDTSISNFRDQQDILATALVNFAALLGWSHRQKSDVMDLEELGSAFDLKFTKGNTIVSLKKLEYFQARHVRRYIEAGGPQFGKMITDASTAILEMYGISSVSTALAGRSLKDVVASMLRADSKSYSSPNEFAKRSSYFLEPLANRGMYQRSSVVPLSMLRTAAACLCLVPTESWTADNHRSNIAALQVPGFEDATAEHPTLGKAEFHHYMRWALLGGKDGLAIPQLMEILGKDICVDRIRSAALETVTQETMETTPEITSASFGNNTSPRFA